MLLLKVLDSYNYFSLSRSLTLLLTEEFGVSDYRAGGAWPCAGRRGRCRRRSRPLPQPKLPRVTATATRVTATATARCHCHCCCAAVC